MGIANDGLFFKEFKIGNFQIVYACGSLNLTISVCATVCKINSGSLPHANGQATMCMHVQCYRWN